MKIIRFEDVEAWKEARILVKEVYATTRGRPFLVDRDLQRQMRKAAVSAMANIAEGFDAGSDPEFRRFLRIARRSASELQSHFYLCLDERCVTKERFEHLYAQARKVKELIGGFLRYLSTQDIGRRT